MHVNNRYRVGKKLGAGNFGEIRLGKDDQTKRLVAIKFETSRQDNPQLHTEYRHYRALHKNGRQNGIPEIYYYGTLNQSTVLVIELLGPSLEELFDLCGRKFSANTVFEIARQTIRLIEVVHSKHIIHRDIKPENFLIGYSRSSADQIHIVDFGLSKEYVDQMTNRHIPNREHKHLTGTARYMSINTHMGREQSRRDDLEALCHMYFYFLRGSLPWQGLKADNLRDRYTKICEVKRNTPIETLCADHPEEFAKMLRYSRQLNFEDTPNYEYLVSLIDNYMARTGGSNNRPLFDWKPIRELKKSLTEGRDMRSSIISDRNDRPISKDGTPLVSGGLNTSVIPLDSRQQIGSNCLVRSNLSITNDANNKTSEIAINTINESPPIPSTTPQEKTKQKTKKKFKKCCCL